MLEVLVLVDGVPFEELLALDGGMSVGLMLWSPISLILPSPPEERALSALLEVDSGASLMFVSLMLPSSVGEGVPRLKSAMEDGVSLMLPSGWSEGISTILSAKLVTTLVEDRSLVVLAGADGGISDGEMSRGRMSSVVIKEVLVSFFVGYGTLSGVWRLFATVDDAESLLPDTVKEGEDEETADIDEVDET